MSYKRKMTREVRVGDVKIGGNNPISVQSMTNTDTRDVEKTVAQIKRLEEVGCDIVRVAVVDMDAAKSISKIKEQVNIPIIADIHFDYRLALEAIEQGIDGIRINPGNIGSIERVRAVVEKCKERDLKIRIGVNGGSLEKELLKKYAGKLLITQGSKGVSTCLETGEILTVPARPAKVVDTTGAGDTLNGAFSVQIANGADIKTALTFANTAASLSTEKFGAQTGMPTVSEVEKELQ